MKYYYINHPVFYHLRDMLESEPVEIGIMTQIPKYFFFAKNKIDPNIDAVVHSPWIHDIPWRIKGHKIVIEEFLPRSSIQQILYNNVVRSFRDFITLTPDTQAYLERLGKRVFLLPPLISGRFVKNKDEYILAPMRLENVKNPEMIRYLAERLPEQKFIVLTNGYINSYYLNMLSLPNVEIIKEKLPLDKARDYIKRAALVVLPSWKEAFGMVVVEALSYGTPVLLSDKTGVSSFFKGQDWVLPPERRPLWVEKVKDLLKTADPARFYEYSKIFSKTKSPYLKNFKEFKSYLENFV